MSDMPNFSTYSLRELEEAYHSVDREKYPDNHRAIIHEIGQREKVCAALYESALTALKKEDGQQSAIKLFQKIVDEYPAPKKPTFQPSTCAIIKRRVKIPSLS